MGKQIKLEDLRATSTVYTTPIWNTPVGGNVSTIYNTNLGDPRNSLFFFIPMKRDKYTNHSCQLNALKHLKVCASFLLIVYLEETYNSICKLETKKVASINSIT
ncbi:hypothetical protein R6Q59_015162 [Mikania micrantha]